MHPFLHHLNKLWLRYEYKHTTSVLVTVLLFLFFFDSALITGLLERIEGLGYFAAFIAGLLMVSFFTVVPAVVLVVALVQQQGLDPLYIAIIAGFGSMLGDWLLLISFKEHIFDELRPLFTKLGLRRFAFKLRHKYTSWLFFLAGAVVITTPIPDEIGVAMLGISHFARWKILLLCFVLNGVGIFALAEAAKALGS